MDYRKIIAVVVIAAGACYVGRPISVNAAKFNVSTVTEFQNALNTAGSNRQDDIIHLQAGVYLLSGAAMAYSNDSLEDFSIKITGRGPGNSVLDGQDLCRILGIDSNKPAGHVTVEKLSFRNGKTGRGGCGGGLFVQTGAADIKVTECEFSGNFSGLNGGGVYAWSSSGGLTIEECVFTDNSAASNGGGLYAWSNTSGPVRIADNHVELNAAATGDGGGAYARNGTGTTTVTDNTVRNLSLIHI